MHCIHSIFYCVATLLYIYGNSSISHAVLWVKGSDGVTVHNSSTSSPGWAMTMPGPSCAVNVKQHEH